MKTIVLLIISITSYYAIGMSQKAPKTPKKLKAHKHAMQPTGKLHGYFQIEVEKIDNGNGDIRFVAQVLPQESMNGEFKWKLPENAKVTSGELSGTETFQRNTISKKEIFIEKSSLKNNDQIFFFAYKMKDGERHGGSHSLVYKENPSDDEGFQKSQFKVKKSLKIIE